MSEASKPVVWPGKPYPLGSSWDGEGVNFALYSEHAEKVELCLFDASGKRETARVQLPEQTDMGEEFGATTPFLFFCNFDGDLAKAVSEGRRNEFSHFPLFKDPTQRERIPDPNAIQTFEASRLDWNPLSLPTHLAWKQLYQTLLTLRREHILPLISGCAIPETSYELAGASGLSAHWQFPKQSRLTLLANLGDLPVSGFAPPVSKPIYVSDGVTADSLRDGMLPALSVAWVVEP